MRIATTSSSTLAGILFMLTAMWCFSCMNIAIRALVEFMPSTQMVFLRNVVSLIAIALWILVSQRGFSSLKTVRIKGHFWRAAVGIIAMEMWFYSLSVLPLTLATALSFTTPIFATILAITMLGEKAGWRRWVAIIMGFIGVLIIIRPGHEVLHIGAFVVLGSSAFMALAGTLVKTLTRTERSETIVFYMALFMIPLSFPPAIPQWQPVHNDAWGLLVVVAVFSTAAHLMLTRAFRRADMVVLVPFDYTRLVFTAILAYIFFGEVMGAYTVIGAAVIMCSSLYIAHREAVRHREAKRLAEVEHLLEEEST